MPVELTDILHQPIGFIVNFTSDEQLTSSQKSCLPMPGSEKMPKYHLIGAGLILGTVAVTAISAQAASLTGQCAHLPINKTKLVPDAIFPVNLAPYGDVCFVAYKTRDTIPSDLESGVNPKTTTYIALSLYQTGKDVYDFTWPNTPGYLWNWSINKIVSVSFKKLKGDNFTDVIVIGHGWTINANDLYQPLIFRGSATGFQLDENLSSTLFTAGPTPLTMPELIKRIEDNNPPPSD